MPRKCAATGRIIEAKDHASVQIAIADVDENGKMIPGQTTNLPIAGFIRHQGESDDSVNRLTQELGRTYTHKAKRCAAAHCSRQSAPGTEAIPLYAGGKIPFYMERTLTYSG